MIMTSDQGPVVQSALLRSELVRLRKDKGLTQQQVAAELAWSPSKIIRIEGGHSSITQVDLDALLGRYGRTADKERERLQTLNRDARKKGWWDRYREVISAHYLAYVGYESGAASVRQFQGSVVPGLLQTREYAEVLTANSIEDEDKAGPVVKLRLQRQTELAKRKVPPHQTYVLDEAAIRRHVGIHKDPAIMPAQLQHIVDRARSDDLITIRVILFEAGVRGPERPVHPARFRWWLAGYPLPGRGTGRDLHDHRQRGHDLRLRRQLRGSARGTRRPPTNRSRSSSVPPRRCLR